MLENPVPNSCDVVRVTNNDSRSGQLSQYCVSLWD